MHKALSGNEKTAYFLKNVKGKWGKKVGRIFENTSLLALKSVFASGLYIGIAVSPVN